MRIDRNLSLLLVIGQCLACTGSVDEDKASDPGKGPGSGTGSEPAVAGVVGACEDTGDPGFVGMRRLTRSELNHTLQDLLGDSTNPADVLPNEDSLLAAQSAVSALAFEKLEAVVSAAVEAAWQRDLANPQISSAKLRRCDPLTEGAACAERIVTEFVRQAVRRPVTPAELAPFLALVQLATTQGDTLDVGVKLAVKAALLDPEFVFRVEPDTDAAKVRSLSAHELAARLSFWLWETTPDATLSQLADSGKLSDSAVVQEQLVRMVSDPRAERFADGLGVHWLGVSSLQVAQPNAALYPDFNEELRSAMAAETTSFFRAFFAENLPVPAIVNADFTFLNSTLRSHYGFPEQPGSGADFQRATLPDGVRRGILGHASVLTMTSAATRTSPVKRGKWLFSKLLCGHMPPPPPMVDILSEQAEAAETERERLAVHRANPACAGCHNILDPIGLGLENFDGIGRYREQYDNGRAIDPAGQFAGGGSFATLAEMQALLAADPRVATCAQGRVFTHAVGREPHCPPSAADPGRTGLKDIALKIGSERAFTHRRGELEGDVQ